MTEALQVLFVDNSDHDVLELTRHLEQAGHKISQERVETSVSMGEALEARDWDVILCELKLPDFSAQAALKLAQSCDYTGPFLIISSADAVGYAIADLMKAGVHDLVLKHSLARLGPALEYGLKEARLRRERSRAIEELEISEQRFRDIAEASADWLWEMDADFRYTYFSPSYEQHSGKSIDKAVGCTRAELYADILPRLTTDEFEQWEKFNQLVDARLSFRDCGTKWVGSNGKIKHFSTSGKPIFDAQGDFMGYRGVGTNITERKQVEERLSYQASHDALTGLINREEFERRAERLLSVSQQETVEHALCFMDLDQFKVINDTCGHGAGDELLRQLGRELKKAVRRHDTLARLGGDEFGVLMEHCPLAQAQRAARKLQQTVQNFQFSWEGQPFRIGASIGLVAINKTTSNLTELLKQADAACYMAKDLGRNRIHTFYLEDAELAHRHGQMQWVARINQALEENRFSLYAQAIVPLGNNSGRHYELLLRMLDEEEQIILPGAFLPAAERYDLTGLLDNWVIGNAFNLLASHPVFLEEVDFISINLSGPSLTDADFLDTIISRLETTGIEPAKICFEVTETAAISNLNAAIGFITNLKQLGCRFALDDFGSGLSSFGYLKTLPVDYLKIDGMFVRDMVDDPIDHAMIESINNIGQVMGIETIAEFVENDEIRRRLEEIGVNYAQGYGIEKPQPFEEILWRSNSESSHPGDVVNQ